MILCLFLASLLQLKGIDFQVHFSAIRQTLHLIRHLFANLLLENPLAQLPQVGRERLILCLVRLRAQRVIRLSQIRALVFGGIFGNLSCRRGPERRFGTLVGRHEGDATDGVDGIAEEAVRFGESGFLAGCNG